MAVTQNEIARITGLSRSTVSGILSGRFAHNYHEETRQQVFSAAERLNYRPNRQALTLKTGKSGIVGIVHTGSVLPLTHQKISAVVRIVESHQLEPLVYHNTWFQNSESIVEMLLANKVQGVVLINNYHEDQEKDLKMLMKSVPVVQLGGIKHPGVPLVATDTAHTVQNVVQHLSEEGWGKIVMLAPTKTDSLLNPVSAFLAALSKAHSHIEHEVIVVPWKDSDRADVFAPGARGLELLQQRKPGRSAVIAHDDNWAIGFHLQCLREGIRIPDDYGLVGYDNVILGNRMPSALTTVEQPIEEMAAIAVELLLNEDRNPRAVKLFQARLILRESSRNRSSMTGGDARGLSTASRG